MKIIRSFIVVMFACAFFAVALLTVHCSITFPNAKPILLSVPESASDRVTVMMDAVCSGDFDTVSQLILGSPDLGVKKQIESEEGALLWNAYLDSMSYELDGECYATEKGIAQDVLFTSLSLDNVTSDWYQRAQALLKQRVAEAEDLSEVYDDNYEYREDFVMNVLLDAAQNSLAENTQLITQKLTIEVQYHEGQWLVVADRTLLNAIFKEIL